MPSPFTFLLDKPRRSAHHASRFKVVLLSHKCKARMVEIKGSSEVKRDG